MDPKNAPYRLILVDDSSFIRKLITDIFRDENDFEVVGVATDGQHGLRLAAQQALKGHAVEVVILDIEMPILDGLSALQHFTSLEPAPKIVMASSLTKRGAAASLRALTMGASDYVCKPANMDGYGGDTFRSELVSKVRCWAKAARRSQKQEAKTVQEGGIEQPLRNPVKTDNTKSPSKSAGLFSNIAKTSSFSSSRCEDSKAKTDTNETLSKTNKNEQLSSYQKPDNQKNSIARPHISDASKRQTTRQTQAHKSHPVIKAIAIGGSTGAPQALHKLLGALKYAQNVPIFITQHMPPSFTTILAEQLSKTSGKKCIEAQNGETITNSSVFIAPGDFHMRTKRSSQNIVLDVYQDEPINFCRPSVDPMFSSLANCFGKNLLAIVLTGMGHDGLDGCKDVAKHGGYIIAQDEATSVVWGMPGAVTKAGLANLVLPLDKIAPTIDSMLGVEK